MFPGKVLQQELYTWDIKTGKKISEASAHLDQINSILPFKNGRILITGSNDGTIKFWSMPDLKELATLYCIDEKDWVVTTPDNRFDASPDAMKLVYRMVWDKPVDTAGIKDPAYVKGLLGKVLGK